MCSCKYCGRRHLRQAFISHSRSDKPLASRVQDCCCEADIYPVLFEMPREVSAPASVQIVSELVKSSVYFSLLGPEVSKRAWTQAWMAFEGGVFGMAHGVQSQPWQKSQRMPTMFLIEDISQSNDAAVPLCDIALLLDFADAKSWLSIRTLLSLLSPTVTLDPVLLAESNRLRLQNLFILDYRCPNPNCRSIYQIHIWMGQRAKRQLGTPDPPRSFSIKCSMCRRSANVRLVESASGPPNWDTTSRQPRPDKLPLPHISRLV